MYQLLSIDVDGTLLNSQHQLSRSNKQTILSLSALGIPVSLTTGKHYDSIKHLIGELRLFAPQITSGGAVLKDVNGGNIYSARIELAIVRQVAALAKRFEVSLIVLGDYCETLKLFDHDLAYMLANNDPFPRHVNELTHSLQNPTHMMAVAHNRQSLLLEFEQELILQFPQQLETIHSAPYYLDIMPIGVTKGSALGLLAEKLNMNLSQIICMGDGLNDISSFDVCGYSVAMGNAKSKLKAKANYISKSNDESGVAYAIKYLQAKKLLKFSAQNVTHK